MDIKNIRNLCAAFNHDRQSLNEDPAALYSPEIMRVEDHADILDLCVSGKAVAISLSCQIDWLATDARCFRQEVELLDYRSLGKELTE